MLLKNEKKVTFDVMNTYICIFGYFFSLVVQEKEGRGVMAGAIQTKRTRKAGEHKTVSLTLMLRNPGRGGGGG